MLSGELRHTNYRDVLLTDEGLALFRRTVALLDEFDFAEGLAAYSDVSTACRRVLQDCLSKGVMPGDGAESLKLIADQLDSKIATYTYIVPPGCRRSGVTRHLDIREPLEILPDGLASSRWADRKVAP